MLTIFSKVLVIFLMMAVGYLAQKKTILPEGADDIMNAYVMKLACPCLIISSMATSELRRSAIVDTLQVAAGTVIFFIVTLLIAWLFLKAIHYTPKEDWGMKYIVITTKHHDGFAMYDSKCSDYNIVKATPFGRDILKELQMVLC